MRYIYTNSFIDIVGIIGVLMVLVAYYLLSVDRLQALSLKYQILNFIGSWLILFSLIYHWNLPSVLIEIAWIVISLIGIYRCFTVKKN